MSLSKVSLYTVQVASPWTRPPFSLHQTHQVLFFVGLSLTIVLLLKEPSCGIWGHCHASHPTLMPLCVVVVVVVVLVLVLVLGCQTTAFWYMISSRNI